MTHEAVLVVRVVRLLQRFASSFQVAGLAFVVADPGEGERGDVGRFWVVSKFPEQGEAFFILALFQEEGGQYHAGTWLGQVIRSVGDEGAQGLLGILVFALFPERPGQLQPGRPRCRGPGVVFQNMAEISRILGRNEGFPGVDRLLLFQAVNNDVGRNASDEQQDEDDQLLLMGIEELFELGGSLFNFAEGGGMVGPLHLFGEVRCSFVFGLLFLSHGSAGKCA